MLPAIGFYKRHAVRAMGDQMLSIGTANALGLPPREVTTVLVAFAQTRVEHRPFFDFIRPVLQQNAACLSGKEAAFALEASRRVGMADQLLVGTLVSRFVEATEADIESKARFSRLLCIEVAHCATPPQPEHAAKSLQMGGEARCHPETVPRHGHRNTQALTEPFLTLRL
eukprot:gene12451-19260_t